MECVINQEFNVACLQEGNEVYVPFSFLHNYFEVYGSLSTVGKHPPRFDWTHTNAKINYPKAPYDPKGIFMYFENYNVEVRDRVKCISASENVPISTQWESQGYFYPTQIAQFGLSHYSKNLTDPEPRRKVSEIWLFNGQAHFHFSYFLHRLQIVEDSESYKSNWVIPNGSNLTRDYDKRVESNVLTFTTSSSYDSAITLALDQVLDLVVSINVLLKSNSSIMITVQNRETKQLYHVHYIVADVSLSTQEENFYYGIGLPCDCWKRLTRDLFVDVQKGIQLAGNSLIRLANGNVSPIIDKTKRKLRRTDIKIISIGFVGSGSFDNVTIATTEHIAQFYDAADWFVRNQNEKTGGWSNPVKRKISEFAELKQGWYSAMGQGHAISLLARAFYHSNGDSKYLRAAINGMKPFRVPSRQGGVLARFMGKFDWYEEYPTTPSSFVLNGFIYSLLGLYDLKMTAPSTAARDASFLYDQGMISLKRLLLLYDTGSGSVYDLRHVSLGKQKDIQIRCPISNCFFFPTIFTGIEPNIARWDYHATHVNQLLLLATIDRDPIFSRTAERWRGYMFGKRAQHN